MSERAGRIHPSIRRYYIFSLDITEAKRNADAGEPFLVRLGETTVNVLVQPEPILEDTAEIIEISEGEKITRRTTADNITYVGRVVEAEELSEVRLTITQDMLTGYVFYDGDWWFIEPLRKFGIDVGKSDHLLYRTKDLRFKFDLKDDVIPVKEEQFEPGSLPEGSGYLPPPPPPSPPSSSKHQVGPNIGIALVADYEYDKEAKFTGAKWHQQQISVLHNVNGLYKKNLGCWFSPKIFILSYKGLKNCIADKLLDDLEDTVKNIWGDLRLLQTRKNKGTEVAHLTSGKDLDGKTLGIAWRPGVYSLSQQQLFVISGGGGFGGPPNLAFQNMMIMSHELGHNFNTIHAEADKWCVSEFIICWDYERSLMWPTFYDDNNDWVSDGQFNQNHNNRKRIKYNMANQRNHNF